MSNSGKRVGGVYDWWSRHPRAFRLLYAASFLGRESEFRSRAEAALRLGDGDTVLEVGYGPGNSFETLHGEVGESGRVIGVDASTGMTERGYFRAEQAGWSSVHVLQADGERLPIESRSISAAYAAMSLSAIPDPERAVREIYRSLEPGGRLVVLDAQSLQEFPWRLLNRIVVPISRRMTNWVTDVDIPDGLEDVFVEVAVETFTAGAIFIAVASKGQDATH